MVSPVKPSSPVVPVSAKVSVRPPVMVPGVVTPGLVFDAEPTALASASALASVSFDVDRVTEPPCASTVLPSVIRASASDTATFTPSAAPILTFAPLLFDAEGGAPGVPAPLSSGRPVAKSNCSLVCSSAVLSCDGSVGEGSFFAPPALAVASADASERVWASMSTSPVCEVTSRSTTATARSTSTFKATPTPTPASLPAASAAARVVAEPVCSALRVRPRSRVRASPSGSRASVWLTPTVRAIAGLTATSPPAPASAVVVSRCSPNALKLMAPASVTRTSPPIWERVVFTPTLSAKEPPTPTLPPPVSPVPPVPPVAPVPPLALTLLDSSAVASTVLELMFCAVSVTSPLVTASPTSTVVSPERRASVLVTSTFRANAPATPTSPALAPDTAVAPKVCAPSASRPSISASTVRPSDETLPSTAARLVTTALLIAAATPTPMPGLPVDAAGTVRSTVGVAPPWSAPTSSVSARVSVWPLPEMAVMVWTLSVAVVPVTVMSSPTAKPSSSHEAPSSRAMVSGVVSEWVRVKLGVPPMAAVAGRAVRVTLAPATLGSGWRWYPSASVTVSPFGEIAEMV